jgi:hypothetical protein
MIIIAFSDLATPRAPTPYYSKSPRDGMRPAHLTAQLLGGVTISAEELGAAITQELEALRR